MSDWGHQILEELRRVDGERLILATMYRGERCCTRVLLSPVAAGREVISSYVLHGRGTPAGIDTHVRDVLDAHRLRLHRGPAEGLSAVLDVGVLRQSPHPLVPAPPPGRGWVYVTTRWVHGQLLDQALASARDWREQVEILGGVLGVLADLHARLMPFGDVKPSNIVVNREGDRVQVSFIDLDTLREVSSADAPVPTTAVTLEYASPEQRETGSTWLASDVWAFGEMVFRLTDGRFGAHMRRDAWQWLIDPCRGAHPSQRPTAAFLVALLHEVAASGGPPVTRIEGDAPTRRVVEPVTDHPWGAEPALRSGTATSLAPAGEVTAPVQAHPPAPVAQGRNPRRSGRALVFGVGGLLVLGVLAVGVRYALTYWEACEALVELRTELKQHKVDASKNGKATLVSIMERTEEALSTCSSSAEGRATLALGSVWAKRWHMAGARSITLDEFRGLESSIDRVRASTIPEALAAVVAYESAGCRLLSAHEDARTAQCASVHPHAVQASAQIQGEGWAWLRLEVAWADAMAGLSGAQLAHKAGDTGRAVVLASAAMERCEPVLADAAGAPVNGPEALETCVQLAGLARDLSQVYRLAGALLDQRLAVPGVEATDVAAKVYRYVAPECSNMTVGADGLPHRKGSRLRDGGWTDWCRVAGARAVGCGHLVTPPAVDRCICRSWDGATRQLLADNATCYAYGCEPMSVPIEKEDVPWDALAVAGPMRPTCALPGR